MRDLPLTTDFFNWVFSAHPALRVTKDNDLFVLYGQPECHADGIARPRIKEAIIAEVKAEPDDQDSAFFAINDLCNLEFINTHPTIGHVIGFLDGWYVDVRLMAEVGRTYEALISIAMAPISEHHRLCLMHSIRQKIWDDWLPREVLDHMRNMEEINPELDEDVALARMKDVSDRVALRLSR